MTHQKGSAHALLIIGLVVALVGALGFVFWQNFIYKEPVKTELLTVTSQEKVTKEEKKEPRVLTDADVVSMAAAIKSYDSKCTLTPSRVSDFVTADPEQEYYTEGQRPNAYQQAAKIDKTVTFANVTFGCGSQGSVAVLKRNDSAWTLLATDATIYMQCKDVDGSGVPVEVMPLCWNSDMMTKRAVR